MLAALIWANSAWVDSYEATWNSHLAIRIAGAELSLTLREWINSGLMTLFFFVIGLEVRRELDLGELRDRRRVVVPVAAAVGGRWPAWVRVFLLTLVIVDDVGALLVIAFVYTAGLSIVSLLIAAGCFALVLGLRYAGVRRGVSYLLIGVGLWLALLESGVHPTIAGVAMGLLAPAYPPTRNALQLAADRWRSFREQPTSQFTRSASQFGAELRYVFRHLPLAEVHPHAPLAAEAAEAAVEQGAFWPMHDLLFAHPDALTPNDLIGYAESLDLDVVRFRQRLREHTYAGRVARDLASADESGASGTPSFFANGRRYVGAYDLPALRALVGTTLASARSQ